MDTTIALYLMSALVGWCGTPWPRRWPRPKGWPPVPKPDPPPCLVCNSFAGLIGGVVLAAVAMVVLNDHSLAGVGIAAFAGGRIFSDLHAAMFEGAR